MADLEYWVCIRNLRVKILKDSSGILITKFGLGQKYHEIIGEQPSNSELDALYTSARRIVTEARIGDPDMDKFKLVIL